MNHFRHLIVHDTGEHTENGVPFAPANRDKPGWDAVQEVDDWHRQRQFARKEAHWRKWQPHLKHIGYHDFILRSGVWIPCRAPFEVGSHCKENNKARGVCLEGRARFTRAQWWTLRSIIIAHFAAHGDDAPVSGHQDWNPKDKFDPGFDVAAWIKTTRMSDWPAANLLPE